MIQVCRLNACRFGDSLHAGIASDARLRLVDSCSIDAAELNIGRIVVGRPLTLLAPVRFTRKIHTDAVA